MNYRKAVFPGTFDPITLGHLNVIERASRMYDNLTVLVAENIMKNKLFELSERMEFIRESVSNLDNVYVLSWNGLTTDFCIDNDAGVIVRGVRSSADYQYEYDMSVFNKKLGSGIETVFLPCDPCFSYFSSSAARQLVAFGKNIDFIVPEAVIRFLRSKT